MSQRIELVVAFSCVLVAGCADEPGGTGTPPPAADIQDLKTSTYTLDAGQEKYLCYTYRSPMTEKAIVRVEPIQGSTVHHVALFRTTSPEPEGSFECPKLIGLNWEPIWAGGAGAKALDVPTDVGFVVAPNTQYLVQYHLLNADTKPVTTEATIRLTHAPDSKAVIPAGIFAMGTFTVSIPPNTKDVTMPISCNAPRDLNVFAIFPHMHKLGTQLDFVAGKTEADAKEVYNTGAWVFGEQPMAPLDLKVASGDYIRSTCRWDNPNPTEVKFGESTTDEMCFTVLFYSPFTELDGCIKP